jgi:hypothetical protein
LLFACWPQQLLLAACITTTDESLEQGRNWAQVHMVTAMPAEQKQLQLSSKQTILCCCSIAGAGQPHGATPVHTLTTCITVERATSTVPACSHMPHAIHLARLRCTVQLQLRLSLTRVQPATDVEPAAGLVAQLPCRCKLFKNYMSPSGRTSQLNPGSASADIHPGWLLQRFCEVR